jgi:translation initiation factor IF-2
MRARGAQVIRYCVIAADDDIMPTNRNVSHAQSSRCSIIFAINKVDKPNANPEK